MWTCLTDIDFAPNTAGDASGDRTTPEINEGHIVPSNLAGGTQQHAGFGYLALDMGSEDDGTLPCTDGSIFVRGATMFGFKNVLSLVCAMNRAADKLGVGGSIDPSHPTDCEASEKVNFEGENSDLKRSLTKALEDEGSKDRPAFNINDNNGPGYSYKALLYLIGKKSLEQFCGNGASLESAAKNGGDIGNDDIVSVDVVKSDGKIDASKPYPIANADRDENSTVNDVYYNQGGSETEAKDLKCHEMAKMTRDNSKEYADWVADNQDEAQDNENTTGSEGDPTAAETTSCAIDNIGWIVCPVLNFMARIVDVAYGQVASWLSVTPLSTTTSAGSENTMYSAWGVMRNIANIAFVIAFMVIIYSQLTSVGLSNYGIKKLLPKIMVAVILVNVSYWVCAIAIDVSNIAGASLYKLFDGDVFSQGIDTSQFEGDVSSTGEAGWAGLVSALLASAALYLALPALIVALPAALFAIVTVFLVLALRQVLIILLVVISPLAFVALLLPNTEDWFKKWRTLLQTLLLMYPIISVIFGASAMASTIVMNSAQDVTGDGKVAIQLMGALITVLPLAITPIVLKFGGGILGRFGGMINNPNKGPFDAMRKRSEKFAGRIRDRRQAGGLNAAGNIIASEKGGVLGGQNTRRRRVAAAFRSGGQSMIMNADEKDKYAKAGADSAARNYVANRANGDIGYATSLAGGDARTATLVQSYAKQAVKEESEKDIKAHEVLLSGKSIAALKAIVENPDATVEERAAAARMIVDKGGHQNVQDLYNYMMTNTDEGMGKLQQLSADSMLRRKPAGVGAAQANAMKSGDMTGGGYLDSFAQRIEDGKFSAQDIASMDVDDHVRIAEMAASGKLSDGALKQLSAQMAEIEASDTMKLTPEQERALTAATYRQQATKADGSAYGFVPLPPRPPTPPQPPSP